MSHVTTLETQIKDPELLKHALIALKIPYREDARWVYSDAEDEPDQRVLFSIGKTKPNRDGRVGGIGLQDAEDGTYRIVGDFWLLAKSDPATYTEIHHLGNGATRQVGALLREYAMQSAQRVAEQHGLLIRREPHRNPSGRVIGEQAVLTGGYLPSGMSMIVTANNQGGTEVRFEGGVDASCYEYTRPLEDALGQVLVDQEVLSSLDTMHLPTGVHVGR